METKKTETVEGWRWPILIGRVLAGLRAEAGMSQEAAADAMELTRDQLGRLERMGSTDWAKFVAAANVYQTTVLEIIGRARLLHDRDDLEGHGP